MAEAVTGAPLTPEELAIDEFETDLEAVLDHTDAGDRALAVLEMQDKAVGNVHYFGAAREFAQIVDAGDMEHDEGTPLNELEQSQMRETINEIVAPFAILEHVENATPDELPNWQAARERVAKSLIPDYERKTVMESDELKTRLAEAQKNYEAMSKLLATDPDFAPDDPKNTAWKNMYEGYHAFLTEHGRIQLENTDPEVRRRKAVEDLSAALEAHGLDGRVMNVILQAHIRSSEEASGVLDGTEKKPVGTSQRRENITARVAELRGLDCVDPAILAEAELALARAEKAHLGSEAGKRNPNPTAETGGAVGGFLTELGKIRLTEEAMAGINLNINEERLTAELGGKRLGDITGPAYEALEAYKRNPNPTLADEHAIRVHQAALEARMTSLSIMASNRQINRDGSPRQKPADWAVLTRMLRDTNAAYINMQMIKRQDDRERATATGVDNFDGHAPVVRTKDGGYAFRAGDRRVVLYTDRSYAEDFGVDVADLAAAKDPADSSELDTAAAGYGQRRHADGTEWTEGQISVDTLTARSDLQVYLNQAGVNPQQRMLVARGVWLAHQGDPAISQMAAQATHTAREAIQRRLAREPEATRASFTSVLNQLRYFELKQSGEGTYDDQGRDLITVQEVRGTGDAAQTWNVQYAPGGSRRLRGRVA